MSNGKRILMVVANNGFRDEEYKIPKDLFSEAGLEVITAAQNKGEIFGKLGLESRAEVSLSEVDAEAFHAIVFIGGPGAVTLFQDAEALNLAKSFFQKKKIVGAICIAPVILANAGILSKKKATVFASQEGVLKEKGADFTGKPVEVDGNIITASGPEAAKAFGEKIIELLQ